MRWLREFDGAKYTSEDGRALIILKNGAGGKSSQGTKHYKVIVDGVSCTASRLLVDAKAEAMRMMEPTT